MVKYIILDLEKVSKQAEFYILNYFLDINTTVSMCAVWGTYPRVGFLDFVGAVLG